MIELLRNKKADVASLIISLIVILFIVGIGSLIFSKVFLMVTSQMKEQEEFSNTTINTITGVEEKTIPLLDYFFLFCFIAIVTGLIISSIYIDVHPAIAIIFLIALIVAVVLAGIFSNAFVSIGEDPALDSTYQQFTYTKMIVTHFPLLVFVVGLIIVLVLYGKGRSEAV